MKQNNDNQLINGVVQKMTKQSFWFVLAILFLAAALLACSGCASTMDIPPAYRKITIIEHTETHILESDAPPRPQMGLGL